MRFHVCQYGNYRISGLHFLFCIHWSAVFQLVCMCSKMERYGVFVCWFQLCESRFEEELKRKDMKIILELDQKHIDQQNLLCQAGIPGFSVTNNPQEIQLQMFMLMFIMRLGEMSVPSWPMTLPGVRVLIRRWQNYRVGAMRKGHWKTICCPLSCHCRSHSTLSFIS